METYTKTIDMLFSDEAGYLKIVIETTNEELANTLLNLLKGVILSSGAQEF